MSLNKGGEYVPEIKSKNTIIQSLNKDTRKNNE